MDKYLKNRDHTNRITSNTYNTLRKVHQIIFGERHNKFFVQALVLSKLDYCNSLWLGSPEYQLDKLQCIQNMACRVIFQLRKHDDITHHLKSLHWLKIRERIAYKIASIICRCKNSQALGYLQELPPSKHHEKSMRSSRTEYINSNFCKNTHTLRLSFSAAGPENLELTIIGYDKRKKQWHLQKEAENIPIQHVLWISTILLYLCQHYLKVKCLEMVLIQYLEHCISVIIIIIILNIKTSWQMWENNMKSVLMGIPEKIFGS